MWFSEKALVFVDSRTAAVAVYRRGLSGLRLLRFASEISGSRGREGSMFADVLGDARDAVTRLARSLNAPPNHATLLLPLGAAFPLILDTPASSKALAADVDEAELVRFRLAPLLPFPIAQAEVRTEATPSLGAGVVLAQAMLKSNIAQAEMTMSALGFHRAHVASALSAALRGLGARARTVDLVLGDSACAVALRDDRGAVQAIHLRLLLEGEDWARRSIDEAIRATSEAREIRVLGGDVELLRGKAPESSISPAFDLGLFPANADPQRFPFLGLFHKRPA